jgi:hypothetical protein
MLETALPSLEVRRTIENIDAGHIERLHAALGRLVGDDAVYFQPSTFEQGAMVHQVLSGSLVAFHRNLDLEFGQSQRDALGNFLDRRIFPRSMDRPIETDTLPLTPYAVKSRRPHDSRYIIGAGRLTPIRGEQELVRDGVHDFYRGDVAMSCMREAWPRNTDRFLRLDIGSVPFRHAGVIIGGLRKVLYDNPDILPSRLRYRPVEIVNKDVSPRRIGKATRP